jgi:DNA-binding MarR family transcriptional regulator
MNAGSSQDASAAVAADDVTLGLLRAIEDDPHQTQRGLAGRLGIAVGLTNAVLKRAVAKGLIKVATAPARRYAYYLTPQGFAEKSRLTLQYLEHSLTVVRDARDAFAGEFAACQRLGWTRIALLGGGEMADIALLGAQEAGLHPLALIAPTRAGQVRAGVPVVADVAAARALATGCRLDAIVLTEVFDEAARRRTADAAGIAADRLLAPAFLCPNGGAVRPDGDQLDNGPGASTA